jgi:hypothetical protein
MMAPPRKAKPKPERDYRARLAINALAAKVAKAQAHDMAIVLVLRERPPRKVRGKVELRRIDPNHRMTGRDGESNLIIKIAGEEIALEHISEIRRPRATS